MLFCLIDCQFENVRLYNGTFYVSVKYMYFKDVPGGLVVWHIKMLFFWNAVCSFYQLYIKPYRVVQAHQVEAFKYSPYFYFFYKLFFCV